MKKLLTFLIASTLLVACNNTNKKAEVKTDPAKFTLTVINNTDQDMKWEQSWAMTGPDSGVVAAGDTVELSSNEVDSDHINVYCDNVCNKGYPTKQFNYEGTNWIYATEWLKDPAVQTNTTNTVTITTEAYTPPVVEIVK